MIAHRFVAAALCALALSLAARPVAAQTPLDPRAEKIKRRVAEIGLSAEISVLRKGDDYHGVVTKIDAATFDVADVDYRRTITVRYAEVQKVRSGYDGVNLFTGRHTSHPRGSGLIAAAAIFGPLLTVLLVGLAHD